MNIHKVRNPVPAPDRRSDRIAAAVLILVGVAALATALAATWAGCAAGIWAGGVVTTAGSTPNTGSQLNPSIVGVLAGFVVFGAGWFMLGLLWLIADKLMARHSHRQTREPGRFRRRGLVS